MNPGLMNNVMVTGGNTITPYFNTLVKNSFSQFAKENNMDMQVSTTNALIADKTSWIGGAILGSIFDFDSFYITRQ